MSIKPIAQSSIHRICTGQIIDGIAMAVKELIENSIDAGATMIGNYLN
jgi:DNA mismatch repair protein PMS2